jgi:hypothetical protein
MSESMCVNACASVRLCIAPRALGEEPSSRTVDVKTASPHQRAP